jgi:peptide/nickel transport system ATP-binding protein
MNSQSVLEIEDLHVEISTAGRRHRVLRGVNLNVPAGSVHALVGESGGGKSMVTRAATGLLPRNARILRGRIRVAGQDVTHWSERQWRAVRGTVFSMVLQDPLTALNPVRRIGAQMADVLHRQRRYGVAELQRELVGLLERVHLRDPERVLRQHPHELSGGMRQRVVIAMAWACRPQLILCDEPTTALDVTVQKEVLKLIRELASEGQGVLLVTHDLGVVAKLARSMSVIHAGRILEDGTVAEVYAQPRHDYTRALIAATPRFDRPGQRLVPVDEALIVRLNAEAEQMDLAENAQ